MIEQVQIRSLKCGGDLTRDRGMIESVRQQWLYSTQACAAIHYAMMAMSLRFVLYPAGWQQVRMMASSVMKRRKLSVRYREVLTVYMSEMQPLKRRRMVHTLSELKPGLRWIRQSSCRSTITSCSCVVQL